MSDSSKKRKIEPSDEVNEIKRLKNVFTNTDALYILEHLQALIEDRNMVQILSQLFPENEFPALELSEHCVRCHENYDPKHNTNNRCVLGHTGEIMTEQTEEGIKNNTTEMLYTWECCGVEFKCFLEDDPTEVEPTKGICFRGNHTSNVNYVENFIPCEECSDEYEGEEYDNDDDDDEDQ